jgi:hypothetical protein
MLEGNPWRQLPEAPPFVLPQDDKVLRRYPKLRENLRLDFLPVPFHGSDRADILLLSSNPGARINTLEDDETFVKERRPGLLFESTSLFPFSCLNPAFSNTAGYDYSNRRLGSLIERVGREVVAQRVLLVEYFPYRSSTWRPVPDLPSQRFGFSIVEKAIDEGKLIVVVRGRRYWLDAVPKLRQYDYIELRSPRSGHLSPNNMSQEGFDRLLAKLESSTPADVELC